MNWNYNGANSYLFVNGTDIHKFKAKGSEMNAIPLFLGNISKAFLLENMKKTGFFGYVYDFSVDYDAIAVENMKKTGFFGYVYDFSVDYDAIAVDNILDIYEYLMENYGM